jgi:hypothetical protein
MLKLTADCDLMFRYWPPECVVYNVSNSSSHVLDTSTAEFLEKIQQCEMYEKEVQEFFAKKFVNSNAEEIERHVDDVVANLQKTNLLKVTLI